MDFAFAVKTINKLLKEKQPYAFNSSWIRINAPDIYRFIQKNIRTETGGIDWDRITRALDRKAQRKWSPSTSKRRNQYWDETEVGIILQEYHDKLYTFISQADKSDKHICDIISIALVRVAQKGNMTAQQEIIRLLSFTIDVWIERCPRISCWQGNDYLIQKNIEGCIRRYRYSGSFLGYLFRTLEYSGRGLRSAIAYSLDDSLPSGQLRRGDRIGQNPETGEILIYGRNIHML